MPQRHLLPTMGVCLLVAGAELMLGVSRMDVTQAQFVPPNLGAPRTTAGGGVRFKPPINDIPANTAGGAMRSRCLTDKMPLIALVPSSKGGKFGLTTEARPTFFLYLPKTPARTAELVLKDREERDVYRTMMPLSGQSGLVSVQLPADAPALEVGRYYQWYFNVICKPSDRLQDDFASAWVQRVQPDPALATKLNTATARQRPGIYAEAGIWQDTLTTLVALRRANPADPTLLNDWNSLLESVGLRQIVKAAGDAPVQPLIVNPQPAK